MIRVGLIIALGATLTACRANEPTGPSSPPQTPATPQNPTGPSASIVPAGEYGLSAPITNFDPAWGDFTGYRYTAKLEVRHHPTDVTGIVGTFSDFKIIDAEGKQWEWRTAGTIEGFVDTQGRVTLELKNSEGNFTWWGRGSVTAERIDGWWGRAGHLAGPFNAERVN